MRKMPICKQIFYFSIFKKQMNLNYLYYLISGLTNIVILQPSLCYRFLRIHRYIHNYVIENHYQRCDVVGMLWLLRNLLPVLLKISPLPSSSSSPPSSSLPDPEPERSNSVGSSVAVLVWHLIFCSSLISLPTMTFKKIKHYNSLYSLRLIYRQ